MMALDLARAGIWLALLALAGGCVTSARQELGDVSTELTRRTGHALTHDPSGKLLLPPGLVTTEGLSEDEAVTIALWNNQAFQETLADLGLSQADLAQAGMLPNPTFSMLFPVGLKPLELTAKYPLEVIWLRPGRVRAAKLDLERTAQRLVQSGLDLIRDVRVASADFTVAQERLRIAGAVATVTADITGQAEARLRAGDTSELEAAGARIDSLLGQEQLARAQHDVQLARARLGHLLGLGLEAWPAPPRESPLPPALEVEPGSLLTNALAARPDVRAAGLGLEAAGKRVGLARAEILALTAAVNAKEVGQDLLAGPGLDLAIPIFNQNQGGVALAKARVEKAARQYLATRDRVVLEVREAHARLSQARESHDQWQRNILPRLEESLQQAEQAYAAGNVSYLVVLESRRKLFESRLKVAAVAADWRRAHAELERAVGRRLTSALGATATANGVPH